MKTTKTTKTTVEITCVEIDDEQLIAMLNITYGLGIPQGASVWVHIPGGGDWSNTTLSISKADPISVKWEVRS